MIDKIIEWLTDFYANNKELSIAVAGVLVGAIISWIFNKLGPWMLNQLRNFIGWIGGIIGGHFAYARIQSKYLNWVVLQTQDLNLTGIISTGEKPKLEQIFISLKMVEDNQIEEESEEKRNGKGIRQSEILKNLRMVSNKLENLFQSTNKKTKQNPKDLNRLFVAKSFWKLRQYFEGEAVNNLVGWIIIIMILVVPSFIGFSVYPNVNNFFAGLSATIYCLSTALFITLLVSDYPDKTMWLFFFVLSIIPDAVLIYIIKVRIIVNNKSPIAIIIGIILGLLSVLTLYLISSSSPRKIRGNKKSASRDIGLLLDSNDYLAILGKPGSGKSTYIQYIALTFAQDKAGQHKLRKHRIVRKRFGFKKWYLPILIPLRKVSDFKEITNHQNNLLEAFRHTVLPSDVKEILTYDFYGGPQSLDHYPGQIKVHISFSDGIGCKRISCTKYTCAGVR